MNKTVIGYVFLFVLSVALRLYGITNPLADWHSWRQANRNIKISYIVTEGEPKDKTCIFGRMDSDSEKKDESGPYDLFGLKEDETIARLATGIKRFTMPDEFNYIKVYKQIADNGKSGWGENSLNALAGIFSDRRQYDKSADYWKRSITEYGPGNDNYKQKNIDQILGNWGQFEPIMTQPAGKGATVELAGGMMQSSSPPSRSS